MNPASHFCRALIRRPIFEIAIALVILLNCLFIGLNTYATAYSASIRTAQNIILVIFTAEFLIRFLARENLRSFFTNGWNLFDLALLVINYIPETAFDNGLSLLVLRVLRVFRVLRLLRVSDEVRLMVGVLIRSFRSLFYNAIIFFAFLYLFAILGISMFRLPDPATLAPAEQAAYAKLMEIAPPTPACSPDPYGTLGEAMFTLFRALTGEDWTDLRYNLAKAAELNVIKVHPTIVTVFHVSWFVLAAFLMVNLLVGAVITNYQTLMEQSKQRKQAAEANRPVSA